jgi:flagellar basal body P-ring formation protein FlgA
MKRLLALLLISLATSGAVQGVHADVMSLPVPLHTIYPKTPLRSEDFTFKEFEVNEVAQRTYLISLTQISQQLAGRALPAGRPVLLRALKRMADVRKGEQTTARYVAGGVEIQGVLVPEQDGVAGDILRAKNPETGVMLLAKVAADGTLSVGAP